MDLKESTYFYLGSLSAHISNYIDETSNLLNNIDNLAKNYHNGDYSKATKDGHSVRKNLEGLTRVCGGILESTSEWAKALK
jgi:hypothetical protein